MTIHEQGARDAFARFLARPGGGENFSSNLSKFQNGHWPTWYVETIGQTGWGNYSLGGWPMEQVHVFSVIDSWVQAGALAVVDIEVGVGPSKDSRRAENQQALTNLGVPYSAVVYLDQDKGDCDGTLTWSSQIAVSVRDDSHPEKWRDGIVTRPNSLVPLEIGSTCASTTAFHLAEGRTVARWPYGHDMIRLFLDVTRFPVYVEGPDGEPEIFRPQYTLPDGSKRLQQALQDAEAQRPSKGQERRKHEQGLLPFPQ